MKQRILPAALAVLSLVITSCAQHPHTPSQPMMSTEKPVALASPTETRAPSSDDKETPWTTWSDKGTVGGLLVLKHIRENLLEKNLHDPHVNYQGHTPVDCSKTNINFRSADGTCNDLDNPHVGAAGVAFGRNVGPEYVDTKAADNLMTPNPAEVSKVFFTRDEYKEVPFLNMIAAVWIQFMNHDWLTHGKNSEKNPHRVPVEGGPDRLVERTKENVLNDSQYKSAFGKVSTNDVTHWWDGSQVYGSSTEELNSLRSFSKGRMATVIENGREILPKNNSLNIAMNKQNQGLEATGFRDNWWVGLSMLHTLFVKEHNAIAAELIKKNTKFDKKSGKWIFKNGDDVQYFTEKQLDEHVFQIARLVNTAIMAKIHTVEWTPAILPNDTLRKGMYANWYGASNPHSWSKFIKKIPIFNKTDWFSSTKSGYLIGGIVGDKLNNHGVPFSITEEFTSVYRLHSLLPEKLNFRTMANKNKVNALDFSETRNEKSYPIMANNDLKDLYYSFGTQLPGQLVLNNFPKFMQELTIPGHGKMDLGMVDIIRDRERGVPRYNQFRRAIGLKPIKSYKDFFSHKKPLDARQKKIIENFNKVYGKDENGNDNVEMIDLLVGTLGEEVRPKNFGFGETQFQIFILMASRRLMADRFFTDSFTKEVYTKTGMNWLDREGFFHQVILRHMPELKPQLKGLGTAFEPWNK
jgi:hypothetical protein